MVFSIRSSRGVPFCPFVCSLIPFFYLSSLSRSQTEADIEIHPIRMIAIERLDRLRQRVSGEVCADAGLNKTDQLHISRVSGGVGANPVGAAVGYLQFVFISQLDASGDKVFPAQRADGFKGERACITRMVRACLVVATPDKAGRPASGWVMQRGRRANNVRYLLPLRVLEPAD